MKQIGQMIEISMAALAFTDVGETESARMMIAGGPQFNIKRLCRRIEQDLIAIAFAEAGCI